MPIRPESPYPDTWRIPDLSEPRYSQSLERGLAILECFTPDLPVLGIADIADRLGMSRSTTHRYVTTLVALGYLQQGARRKYRLGLGVTSLGMSALNATDLREHAHADLAELSHRAGYTTSLAVLEGEDVVCVDRVQGLRRRHGVAGPDVKQGTKLPAYCTALGKVLLAYMPEQESREVLSGIELKPQGPNTILTKGTLRDELSRSWRKDSRSRIRSLRAAGSRSPRRSSTRRARSRPRSRSPPTLRGSRWRGWPTRSVHT